MENSKFTIPGVPDPKARPAEVAYRLNAGLARDYQDALFAEETRVARDFLARRALGERTMLIVGGAGYIGSVLTEHLLSRGYRVRCLDALIYNNQTTVLPFLAHPRYDFLNRDMTDADSLAAALDDVTDVVLLAGLVGDPITRKYPKAAERVNDRGYETTLELLNGRGLNKVVFVSTCSNYGFVEGDRLANEDFDLSPLSPYSEAKVRIESLILDRARDVDYAPTVLRFATAFGLSPRMRFDLTISEFTRDLFRGLELLVYDADTWRPYCHVQDFAEIIRRTLEAPVNAVRHEVFNAGGEVNNFTKRMIVDAIAERIPAARIRFQEHGPDSRNYRVSFEKIRERLRFEPRYTVADGIDELIAAMKQGLFRDLSQPESFYGNYTLDPIAENTSPR